MANASCRRRTASMVRVQFSSEVELSRCASTLTAWYPYTGSWLAGRYSRPGLAVEKPALRSGVHCIGVRTPSRSPSQMLSPMPISSP